MRLRLPCMHALSFATLPVLPVLLGIPLACGTRDPGGTAGQTDSDGSGSGSSAGTSGTAGTSASGSESASGTGTGTASGTGTTSGTSAGSSGGMSCPDPEGVMVSFGVEPAGNMGGAAIVNDCDVAMVTPIPDGTTIVLDCVDGGAPVQRTITVTGTPAVDPLVTMGDAVRLTWDQPMPWWTESFLSLHTAGDPGRLIFAAGDGSGLDPSSGPVNDWLGGPTLAPARLGCPAIPDDCGATERLGLELGWDGTTVVVPDGHHDYAGQLTSYHLLVAQAQRTEITNCADVPSAWYRWLVVAIPEG